MMTQTREWVLTILSFSARLCVSYGAVAAMLLLWPVLRATQLLIPLWPAVPRYTVPPWLDTRSAWQIVLLGGEVVSPFTTAEVSHLQDVHHVIVVAFAVVLGATGVFTWVHWYAGYTKAVLVRESQLLTVAWRVLVLLTLLAVAFFSSFFTVFHQVFFPQGNWAFPADSRLLLTFPVPFWVQNLVLLQAGVVFLLRWQAAQLRSANLPKL